MLPLFYSSGAVVYRKPVLSVAHHLHNLFYTLPTVAYPYDPGALDDLVQSLRETGHGEIAAEIVNCRKAQPRAGGLVITPDKPKPSR